MGDVGVSVVGSSSPVSGGTLRLRFILDVIENPDELEASMALDPSRLLLEDLGRTSSLAASSLPGCIRASSSAPPIFRNLYHDSV